MAGGYGRRRDKYSGATNSSLTLGNLQPVNSGSYTLLASNSIGGPVSTSAAQLTVLPLSAFANAVMQDNPIGYWRLNETNSTAGGNLTAVDMTGNYNGVYGSAAADGIAGPKPASGFLGFEPSNTAAQFTNGVANSFVTIPPLNLNTNTVTIAAWIYPVGTPKSYCGLAFCRSGGDASGLGFTLQRAIGLHVEPEQPEHLAMEFLPVSAFEPVVVCRPRDLAGQRHHLSLQYKRSPLRHQRHRPHGRDIQRHHVDRRRYRGRWQRWPDFQRDHGRSGRVQFLVKPGTGIQSIL